ncbi:MAG TPA: RluA family pseudouridine synthase [Candidatus Limnocylindria bacterium]|nr:RluA family pseudouridine synthase [Candidatus Limnocylindria bacterium]
MASLVVTVPPAAAGMRLDRFLATLPEIGTRARGRQLIDGGHVRVDAAARKPSTALRAGMEITVALPAPVPSALEAQDIPLRVLHEDPDLLVIDKPAGMVVHPAPGRRRDTLVNALLHRARHVAGVGASERPGIVHRLDRDTSGVLAIALTPAALEGLAQQFRERTVRKEYLAVVHGALRQPRGRVALRVGRDPRERKRMRASAAGRGRTALTTYEVLERLPGASLVRLTPHTGRTHQLRVHMQSLGHPIVGDRLYGGARRVTRGTLPPAAAAIQAFPRQALHAHRLAFTHPRTHEPLAFEADLPDDIRALLDELRRADSGSRAS